MFKLIEIWLLIVAVSVYAEDKYVPKPSPTIDDFVNWIAEFEKNYRSDLEFKQKFQIFVDNHFRVEKLNELFFGQTEFKLNGFADMSLDEFKSKILMRPQPAPKMKPEKFLPQVEKYTDLPVSFDWRQNGTTVTPVKDQGSVGTCWAHSAVQNLEGVYAMRGYPLTKLSVEQIVDCDGMQADDDENADCGVYGGWPYLAIQYVMRAGGIETEEDYPYCSGVGKTPCEPCEAPGYNKTKCGPPIPYCSLKDSCQAKLRPEKFLPNLKVVDWKRISENETDIAIQLMNYGPLSIALNAELLQFYHHGVFDPYFCDPKNLDHAVLLVGFGVENSKIFGQKPYWIVKNSWGEKWGEQGYFRILRGKGKCGVNTQVVTAVLA